MIKSVLLDNGIKCCFAEKKNYNEKQAMFVFNYGSCDTQFKFENKNIKQPIGTAHFLEHKMFEMKDKNIFDYYLKYGGSANAYTNANSTVYYFSCVDNFMENMDTLIEMVGELHITDESVDKEKNIIAQEINMYEDDPYWRIYFNTLKCCYSENMVKEAIAGTVESIDEITAQTLKDSYDAFYTCDNCKLVVVGNVDVDSVCKKVEKINLSKKSYVKKKNHYENGIFKKYISEQMDVDRAIYNIGFKENNIINDMPLRICSNNIALKILTDRSSSLWYSLYRDGSADYGFGYDYVYGQDYGCSIIKGENSNYEKIYSAIRAEIDRYLNYGISEDLVKRIAKSSKERLVMDIENVSYLASFMADCCSKNIEVLDILKKYDTIESKDILFALKNNFVEYAVSTIVP